MRTREEQDQERQKERDEQQQLAKVVEKKRATFNTFLFKPIEDRGLDIYIKSVKASDLIIGAGINYKNYFGFEFTFFPDKTALLEPCVVEELDWWNHEIDSFFPFSSSSGWEINRSKKNQIEMEHEKYEPIRLEIATPLRQEIILPSHEVAKSVEQAWREFAESLPHRFPIAVLKELHRDLQEEMGKKLEDLIQQIGRQQQRFPIGEKVKIKHHYSGTVMGFGEIDSVEYKEWVPNAATIKPEDYPLVKVVYNIRETPARPLKDGEKAFLFEDIEESALYALS